MLRRLRRAGLAVIAAAAAIFAADRASPPDLSRYRERSLEVLDRDGQVLRRFTTGDGVLRLLAVPETIDRRYLDLLVATEDRRFWWHPGVDPPALARAAWQLARSGHVVSGGSTLTMQVARLLEPHAHDVGGKLLDIVRALQLEARFSKRDILAMYLTLAPMGGNLEGVRAAALTYFGHEPSVLSPSEAALLVAIPQSPTRLRPDRHPTAARLAMLKLLSRDAAAGSDDAAWPLVAASKPPLHAMHLADRLRAGGAADTIRTTIDGALQRAVEALAAGERTWSGDDANLATLVIANHDRSVLAYLGGADYFGPGGMIDMIRTKRSPGSTLKPFIYGLALDDAIIAPDTIIDDVPVQFGDYGPRNFDRVFRGPVTVREALQQSYNSPAVQLLAEVGASRFAATLRMAGAHLAFPEREWTPGLPLALGGVGVDLEDLTMLYAALANGGRTGGLRFEADVTSPPAASLMTEAAARQVQDILRGVAVPEGVASPRRDIAYKTGTSYGFRDALAIGSSGEYTVAVWVGRTEGTPRPGSYGRNTAAPLLFRIFDLLPPEPAEPRLAQARPPVRAAALRRFAPADGFRPHGGEGAAMLRILFPPAGASIEIARTATTMVPLALEVSGGVPPYRWAVDGRPLPPAPRGASTSWRPDGPGFFTVSVTDSLHRTAIADFRLE